MNRVLARRSAPAAHVAGGEHEISKCVVGRDGFPGGAR
jgi:hypothetical protein